MRWVGVAAALALIGVIFIDTFEALILPRRVRHAYRLARIFYRTTWFLWRKTAPLLPVGRWRHAFLSIFGPLSLFALMAIWATGLISGFALLHWSLNKTVSPSHPTDVDYSDYLYFSGTTFFTLGYGDDLVPAGAWGRTLSVIEAGIGFGFLAVVISYLPILYQAFSRREITISLLDARAGSPPSAGELLRRLADARSLASIGPLFVEWERWSAELLESHLSYPVLRFYRSQHDNQSWVGALTLILDTSAFLIANVDGDGYQARLTFAMARHAAVDLVLASETSLRPPESDRLPATDLARIRESLLGAGLVLRDEPTASKALTELRGLYEPFVNALAMNLHFTLPPFVSTKGVVDNWQTSPGMGRSPGLGDLPSAGTWDQHFD